MLNGLRRWASNFTTTRYLGGITPSPRVTDYAYDGSMLVREGHATGGSLTPATVTATYLIGARGPEYRRDDTQTETDSQGHRVTKARWYVYDGLGSVVGEVDPLGNLTSSPKYDVYGAVRANGGTASSKQGFVGSLGHVSDTETGLIYMRARYYDPSVGRFASEDPGFSGANWFVYANDNPVGNFDFNGREGGAEFILTLEILKYFADCLGWKPSKRIEHFLRSAEGAALLKELVGAMVEGMGGVNAVTKAGGGEEPWRSAEYLVAGNAAGMLLATFTIEQMVLAITMDDDDSDSSGGGHQE